MGLTAATVEIPGGKVGDFMAEHLEKDREWRHGKLRRQADHATLEMDPPERPAKPPAPFDPHALLEARQAPTDSAVLEQALDVLLDRSAAGRRHVEDANTSPLGGACQIGVATGGRLDVGRG
jgi:hypothetical protein